MSGKAEKDKKSAAWTSVLAAVVLTGGKITVGVLTGSLGILAEAAHSGLDLVAALVTFGAIHLSSRPADNTHLYGHGKIENLSALFETFLLFVTCGWIVYESVDRLFFTHVHVEVTFWAFFVMIVSIAVDYSRSRVLYRAAKEHNSQALEADALHFSTDIWSSAVVILGLICVLISRQNPGLHFLHEADAGAALVVALIVVAVSVRLGIRSIQALLDAAPEGLSAQIKETVEKLPGVIDCHQVRLRYQGPQLFVDIHIHMDGSVSLACAHALTEKIEEAIQIEIPDSDITVHPEPIEEEEKTKEETA